MLCQRCGLSTYENDNICTRCRLFYSGKNTYIRKPVVQVRTAKRVIRYSISFLLFAVAFGLIGNLLIGLSNAKNLLISVCGGFLGVIVIALSRRITGVLYAYQLSSATRCLNLHINNALKLYDPDKKNASKDNESVAAYGLALLLKGDIDSGIKKIAQAVAEGSASLETKNNLGVALALHNDLDGAIANWQECMNSSDKHFISKFNNAVAQLSKRNYDIVMQSLSELDGVNVSEIASKIPFYMGLVLLKKGSIAEAHVKFEEAASIDPSNGDIQNNLGICSYLLGDEDDGIAKFLMAQKVEMGNLISSCNLGRIYLNDGLLDKAIASTENALWLDTNNVCVRTTHALTIYALGDLESALTELENLSKLIKTDYELHYQLGRLYIDKNESERGIEQLKTALRLEPDAIEVMSHLGVISHIKKRYDESRRMYQGVLEREPNNVRTLINLSLNYLDNNNSEQALELLKKAQDLSPDLPEIYFNIGCALEMEGNVVEAVENYIKAVEINKKYVPAKFNLALCYLTAESITNAATELEELIEVNPNFGLAHFMLGCAAQQKKNLNTALKYWESAKKYDVKAPDLYTYLGIAYYIKDKIDLAVSHFQSVLRMRDGNAQDYNNLALAQIKNKNIPEAIKAFEKSLSMEPYNPVTHSNLGLAYYFNKDIEKATYEWATVGRLDPEYALKRRNIETATYDDTQAAFPVIDFQSYSLKLAPEYSNSPLKLIPAESPDPWMIDTQDKDLAVVPELKQKINKIRKATKMYKMY